MGSLHSSLTGDELHIAKTNVSTGTPVGNITAGVIGEFYWDSTNNKLYIAEATGTANWINAGVSLDEWTEMSDTPSSISAGLIVQGNAAGDALEFGQALDTTDSPTFSQVTVGSTGLIVGSSTPFSDSAGVLTLQNIDAIDATTETTLEAALDFSFVAGTPIDNQVAIWTGSETIEGDSDLTFDGLNLTAGGSISAGTEFQQSGVTILFGDSGATANDLLVGLGAGESLTTGSAITAVGDDALKSNTTGDDNTAVGAGALFTNIGGSENTAVGSTALFNNTGSFNDAFGFSALAANTTGTNNAAFGNAALELNTTGSDNMAIGIGALEKNILGRRNTALGVIAGVNIASATLTGENTLIGYNTGQGITTGVQNTILGANVIGLSATLSNNIILADGAGITRLQFDSSGDGTIGGGLQVTGALKDSSGDVGTSGQILSSTVTGTNWTTLSAGNVTTSAILTDNFLVRGNGTEDIDIGSISMDSGGTRLRAGAGTELLPTYSFTSNTNRGMYDEGSSLRFSDDGFDVLELIAPSLAANWLQITAAQDDDSAGSIKIIPAGADADIEMSISSKGSQTLNLNTGTGGGEVAIGKGDGLEVGSNGEVGIGIGASTPSGLDGLTLQIRASTIIFGNPNTKTQVEWLSPASNNQLLIGVNDTGSNNADAFVLAPVSSDLVLSTLKKVNVAGNYPFLNFSYTTTTAETGGLVVNYLPTSTTTTVSLSPFVAGVASTSNPTVTTVGAATFSASDIIQITGTEQFENDGLFEVLTHAANLLTIRGVGTTAVVEDFTGNQFIANTSDSATITKVTLSVLRSGTDGIWESASGSTTGFSFADFTVGGVGSFGTPVDNQLAVWTDASTIEGTTGLTFDGSTFTTTGAGVFGGDLTISTDGSSTGAPRLLGFTDYSATEAARFRFGDDANVLQNAFGNAMDLYSFHTLRLLGDRSTTTALAFSTESNIGVHVINTTVATPAFVISGASSQTADLFQVRNNSGTVLSVFDDEGNLGVGTASPSSPFHVVGDSTNVGGVIAEFRNSANSERIEIIDETTTGSLPAMFTSLTGFGIGFAATSGSAPVIFYAGGKTTSNEAMRIVASGLLVGIGTTGPDTKLHALSTGADTTAVLTLETTGTNLGEYKTFVGSQDPDGNVTGAGGDIYVRDSAALSNLFFNKEATTGTGWETVSLVDSQVHEIFSTAEYEALGTASVITTSTGTNALDFKVSVTSTTRHSITSRTAELMFIDQTESNGVVYTSTSDFITSTVGGDVTFKDVTIVAGIAGTQLFNYAGSGSLSEVDVISFHGTTALVGWDLGTISRVSTTELGPIVTFKDGSILFNTAASLVLDSVSIFGLNSTYIDQADATGFGGPIISFKDSAYKGGRATLFTLTGTLYTGESLVRVGPGLPDDYRVNVFNTNLVYKGTATIFDTSGTTGTFTVVANNSIASTSITSVVDSSGVASFTHAGTSPLLNSLVTVSGFTTNTDYNTTGIVTARTATTFEIDYVAFGTTETGNYAVTGVTVTAAAHGLTIGTGVTLDTTLSTQYDGGFLIYNIQTNSFDVPATFSATEAGTWSTKGLDETDPRVIAKGNPGQPDSQVLAFGFTNANATSTTITDGTYAAIDASTFASNSDVTQRFKLTNATNAIFELTALEDFSGTLTGSLTAVKSGSTADYRFAMSTNGVLPVFASANYVPMEVKTTKVNIALLFSVVLTPGDTIQIMVAGDGTSNSLTITDLVFGIQ